MRLSDEKAIFDIRYYRGKLLYPCPAELMINAWLHHRCVVMEATLTLLAETMMLDVFFTQTALNVGCTRIRWTVVNAYVSSYGVKSVYFLYKIYFI
jgi:hypothetical protein